MLLMDCNERVRASAAGAQAIGGAIFVGYYLSGWVENIPPTRS
jgi:hypothetical protein